MDVPLFRKAQEALSRRLSSSFLIDYRYIRIYINTISLYQSVADANGMSLTFAKLTLIVIIIVAWSSILLPMYLDNANLTTSVAAQQNSEEDDLFFRGNNVYQQDRYEEAIEYFDTALAIDPNELHAFHNKGNLMNALIHKGLALFHLERYQEAIEYFDRVLAIDPDHWDALNNNHMNALIHKGLALDRLER